MIEHTAAVCACGATFERYLLAVVIDGDSVCLHSMGVKTSSLAIKWPDRFEENMTLNARNRRVE